MQYSDISQPIKRFALLLASLVGLSSVAGCERVDAGTAAAPRGADAAASAAAVPPKSLYSVVPESFRL